MLSGAGERAARAIATRGRVRPVRWKGSGAFGFNAQTKEYGDLVADGVIDPAKVVRTALQNAASVASLLLTTEALVAEKPEERRPRECRPTCPTWICDGGLAVRAVSA